MVGACLEHQRPLWGVAFLLQCLEDTTRKLRVHSQSCQVGRPKDGLKPGSHLCSRAGVCPIRRSVAPGLWRHSCGALLLGTRSSGGDPGLWRRPSCSVCDRWRKERPAACQLLQSKMRGTHEGGGRRPGLGSASGGLSGCPALWQTGSHRRGLKVARYRCSCVGLDCTRNWTTRSRSPQGNSS